MNQNNIYLWRYELITIYMCVFMYVCIYAVCIYAHVTTHTEVAGFIQPLIVFNETAEI